MITVWRGNYCYKFDGNLGTIEDTVNNDMVFLTYDETKQCNKSNEGIDLVIKDKF